MSTGGSGGSIATRGPDAFYTGANAKAISDAVAKSTRNPALLTAKDLALAKAIVPASGDR